MVVLEASITLVVMAVSAAARVVAVLELAPTIWAATMDVIAAAFMADLWGVSDDGCNDSDSGNTLVGRRCDSNVSGWMGFVSTFHMII